MLTISKKEGNLRNKPSKAGFTLIELLAVIVILAVIALIAVPQVIKILNRARLSSAEDSTYGIVKSAENYITEFMLKNNGSLPDSDLYFYCTKDDGCILNNELLNYNLVGLSKLNFNGVLPDSGVIVISENGQYISARNIEINDFICSFSDNKVTCSKDKIQTYLKIFYLDPTNLQKKCDETMITSKTGVKEGCMKWYAYSETSSTYNLILDHNTTDVVAWVSKDDYIADGGTSEEFGIANNDRGPITALKQLKQDTINWDVSLNPRLISADEVAIVTNANQLLKWSSDKPCDRSKPIIGETISTFFLNGEYGTDSLWKTKISNSENISQFSWLFNYTTSCKQHGCQYNDNATYGYWTSTGVYGIDNGAWRVYASGALLYDRVTVDQIDNNYYSGYGVRPVITIKK